MPDKGRQKIYKYLFYILIYAEGETGGNQMRKRRRKRKKSPRKVIAFLLCCFCFFAAAQISAIALETDVFPEKKEEQTASADIFDAEKGQISSTAEEISNGEIGIISSAAEDSNDIQAGILSSASEEIADGKIGIISSTAEEISDTEYLFRRLMACGNTAEVDAILENLTTEEEAELDAFTAEENAALEDKLIKLGYYDAAVLKSYTVTIQAGKSGTVTVERLDSYSVSCTSNQSGITATYSNKNSNVKITVGSSVAAGTYMVYVKTPGYDGWSETRHTITVTVENSSEKTSYPDTEITYYNGENTVAYDVVSGGSGLNDSDNKYISSVTLNSIDVTQADANGHYGIQSTPYSSSATPKPNQSVTISRFNPDYPDKEWKNYAYYNQVGQGLSIYYNTASAAQEEEAVLAIEPMDGYYVTRVFITCGNGGTPLNCHVWKENLAYDQPFTLESGGDVSVSLSSKWFGHYSYYRPDPVLSNYMSISGLYQYFILIEVAKIPTPTYVEYDYGDIVDKGGSADIFHDVDGWTYFDSRNSYGYGTTVPDTAYTQYKYTYQEDSADSTSWLHYANTITEAAKENAAALGYRFAGWKAEYYGDCTSTKAGAIHGNNYLYTFSDAAFQGVEYFYDEREQVPLYTHVRLIAQWEPMAYNLTIQKTLSGNMYNANDQFAFTVKYGDITDTFWLGKDDRKTISVPYGTSVSIMENPNGYTYSLTSVMPAVTYMETESGLSFTMPKENTTVIINNAKEELIETGILLDTLPYILILSIVAVGTVLQIKKGRNRNDD